MAKNHPVKLLSTIHDQLPVPIPPTRRIKRRRKRTTPRRLLIPKLQNAYSLHRPKNPNQKLKRL